MRPLGSLPFTIPAERIGFPPVSAEKTKTLFRIYKVGKRTDQGTESSCVGHALYNLLAAEPISQAPFSPNDIYAAARKLGKIPPSVKGSNLVDGINFLRSKDLIEKELWATKADQVGEYINGVSPVVLSIPWYERMDETQKDGRVKVAGDYVGGHAIFCFGYDGLKKRFWLKNSWSNWGLDGNGYITSGDLEKLFERGGIACALVEKGAKS